jgi:hypothetical protein
VEYHLYTDDAMGVVEDLDELGKLGRGFSSMDNLEKVDIADSHSSTYICKCSSKHEKKQEIIELLKVYPCYFAWDYTEMPRLSSVTP